MKARPILMSAPMVRALLEGRKTQTRRVVKPQPSDDGDIEECQTYPNEFFLWSGGERQPSFLCPYGKPGDLLWVRETWQLHSKATDLGKVVYRASEAASHTEFHELVPVSLIGDMKPKPFQEGWRSSLHMPRWASRLTLELTEVRVERLQEISEANAIAEGIEPVHTGAGELCGYANYQYLGEGIGYFADDPIKSYASLWESINGPGSWEVNPWVWALTFRVHHQNVDAFLKARAA